MIKKILDPLKALPEGFYRIVLVSFIFIPPLLAITTAYTPELIAGFYLHEVFSWGHYIGGLILFTFLYYVLLRLVVWVYLGFIKGNN